MLYLIRKLKKGELQVMAYGNYGNSYGRSSGNYNRGGYQPKGNQQPEKPPFDLAEHIATKLDIYLMFQEKAKEMGIEVPPEILGGWCTSAMLSMEK